MVAREGRMFGGYTAPETHGRMQAQDHGHGYAQGHHAGPTRGPVSFEDEDEDDDDADGERMM